MSDEACATCGGGPCQYAHPKPDSWCLPMDAQRMGRAKPAESLNTSAGGEANGEGSLPRAQSGGVVSELRSGSSEGPDAVSAMRTEERGARAISVASPPIEIFLAGYDAGRQGVDVNDAFDRLRMSKATLTELRRIAIDDGEIPPASIPAMLEAADALLAAVRDGDTLEGAADQLDIALMGFRATGLEGAQNVAAGGTPDAREHLAVGRERDGAGDQSRGVLAGAPADAVPSVDRAAPEAGVTARNASKARHPFERGQVVEILTGKRAGQRHPVLDVYLAYQDNERPGVSIHDEDTELFYGLDEVRPALSVSQSKEPKT